MEKIYWWWIIVVGVVLCAVEYVLQRIESSKSPRVRATGYIVAGIVALLLFAILFLSR